MSSALKRLAMQVPQVRRVLDENEALKTELKGLRTRWKPGHFYSPIPDPAEVARLADRERAQAIVAVDLDENGQLDRLERLGHHGGDAPFADAPLPGLRYHYANNFYAHADGIVLHAMLRLLRPRRLIEVGSGFSSAMILDTNERFLDGSLQMVFIDPNTKRLEGLLRDSDRPSTDIIASRVQDVPLERFGDLQRGDVLFIDSSHVSKAGSDLNHLLFEVLPRLPVGVHVHFHDIFYPFDYPHGWLRDGVAWNEAYVLRAFLQFNRSFRVTFFTSMMLTRHREAMARHLPVSLRSEVSNPTLADTPGSSLWLERVA